MMMRLALLSAVSGLALSAVVSVAHAEQAVAAEAQAAPAAAQEVSVRATTPVTKDAQAFVEGVARRGIGFLSDANLTPAQQKQAFRNLLRDSFDLTTIGRFALGQYWRVATPEQRTEYQRLFEKMVIDVYSDRFGSYNGQKIKIDSAKPVGDTDSMVTSYVTPKDGGEQVRVDWRVRQTGGRYRIIDVVVEGVSMSVTQRSDFAAVLNRGGGDVAVLLDYLKNPGKKG